VLRRSVFIASLVLVTVAALAGCDDAAKGPSKTQSTKPPKAAPAKPVPPKPAPAKPIPATKPTATKPTTAPRAGKSFAKEVALLYDVLTCRPEVKLPSRFPTKAVQRYCRAVAPALAKQRAHARTTVGPFIAKLRPPGLPTQVVYPFGGADLVTALTTYPDAREITTLSLEHAGDPRPIARLSGAEASKALASIGPRVAAFYGPTTSKSTTLMKMQRGPIPGELAFFMAALAVHGFRPTDLRFFRFEADGSLHYYSAAEIAALDDKRAKRLSSGWTAPRYSPAFSHAEVSFVAEGKAGPMIGGDRPPRAPIRVHRHIAANLANGALSKTKPLLLHLEAKGKVAAMTKAASYLLWSPGFTRIRRYLVEHLAWMISDSTGIPPRVARAAGFEQLSYGRYRRCFFSTFDKRIDRDFVALWRKQPYRKLGFRYGYPDGSGAYHMLITRPAKKK
jgi:hypothetical protein